MSPWFLPKSPDVVKLLHQQSAVTVEGIDAFASWAAGDPSQADVVRGCEHRADDEKRALRRELRTAFTTPLDPEDLYTLSERLDSVLNAAKDTVREAEVMATLPDSALAEMAAWLAEAVRHLDEGFADLLVDSERATDAADLAVRCCRKLEKVYRRAMSALLDLDDPSEQMSRRELYRRLSRIADNVEVVAERIWYSVVKEQ